MRAEPNKAAILQAVIDDLDNMLRLANGDLHELNTMIRFLRRHKSAGTISELHYTVDQERIKRTMAKCKRLILLLLQHRSRAVELLKEQ